MGLFLPILSWAKKIADRSPVIEVCPGDITQIDFTEEIEECVFDVSVAEVQYIGSSAFIKPFKEGRVFFLLKSNNVPVEFVFSKTGAPARYEIFPPDQGFYPRIQEQDAVPLYGEIAEILSCAYNNTMIPGYKKIEPEDTEYKGEKVQTAYIGNKYTCLVVPIRGKKEKTDLAEREFYTPGTVAISINERMGVKTVYIILVYNPDQLLEEIKKRGSK